MSVVIEHRVTEYWCTLHIPDRPLVDVEVDWKADPPWNPIVNASFCHWSCQSTVFDHRRQFDSKFETKTGEISQHLSQRHTEIVSRYIFVSREEEKSPETYEWNGNAQNMDFRAFVTFIFGEMAQVRCGTIGQVLSHLKCYRTICPLNVSILFFASFNARRLYLHRAGAEITIRYTKKTKPFDTHNRMVTLDIFVFSCVREQFLITHFK